ncbi:tetratricopeptide repeat protein [Micromonospora sp. NPDC002389]|uniref:tetratricopeptide repeat protein n=1 Tax=Micromonospora sp. NPDC002389 TaxID=3154272 RepID=UPI003329DD74
MALLMAAGAFAAVANFVPWSVAAGLGALSGATGVVGGVRWQRRVDRRSREAAWAAAVSHGPAVTHAAGVDEESVLQLLLPEHQLVTYSVRHQSLLRELLRWADNRAEISDQVLYVDGHPGSGKTRLLVEFTARVSARCGWVPAGGGEAAVVAASALTEPVVLIVDDADTRDDVPALLAALTRTSRGVVRVVLAARTPQWWPTVRAALPPHALTDLPYRAQLTVTPIVGDAHNQRQVFDQALRSFTPEGTTPPSATLTPQNPSPPIILVHAAAAFAHQQQQHGAIDLDTVAADVFAHEQTRWQPSIHQAGLTHLPGATLHEALLLAALVGAVDEAAAVRLFDCLPTLAGPVTVDTRRRVADWLRGSYPQRNPDWLAPHLPAVLMERHAAYTVANNRALASTLAAATSGDEDRARRLFTTIGRARTHSPHADDALAAIIDSDPYPMAAAAVTAAAAAALALDHVLAASLTKTGTTLTADQLQDLYRLIPTRARRHLLAATAVTLLRTYLNHHTVDLNHPDTLSVRHDLADVLLVQGRYEEAADEFRAVLAARTEVLGPDHPDTLSVRHDLADALSDQGRYDEAAAEFRAVLAARTGVLGPDHPDTLRSRYGLAVVLADQGRYDEAADECWAVLAIRAEVLGPDHPDTLGTRHGLAGLLAEQGRYDQAADECRAVLATRTETLGPDHPDTLVTRHNLAGMLALQGRYDEAADEYRWVSATRAEVLGPDHPNTLHSRHNLASVLADQGRYDEAAAEFQAVLATQIEALGPDHPNTLHSRHNLASVLADQSRFDEAATEFQAVLATQTEVLGPDHPDTLGTRHGLAGLLAAQSRYDEAADEYRLVSATRAEVLGADHPNTLQSRHNLARMLEEQGRYDEAATEFRAVLATQTKVLGPDHPDTTQTRKSMNLLAKHQK